MSNADNEARRSEDDSPEAMFDRLRLDTTRLRMRNAEGPEIAAKVETGNPELNDRIQEFMSLMVTRMDEFADAMDQATEAAYAAHCEDNQAARADHDKQIPTSDSTIESNNGKPNNGKPNNGE